MQGNANLSLPSRLALFFAALSLILAACQQQHSKNSEIDPEIVVAAASNLTDAFEELGPQFTKQTGIRVVFSFGGTADLAKQIENGAPFDVFAAADVTHVNTLEAEGLLTPGTLALYARGSLVVWVPSGSHISVDRIEDLTRKEIERIAIAKPDIAPYGQASVEALRTLKLWEQLEPKVVYGMNVSQVKQFVSSGNAEAGFLPLALVRPGEGKYLKVSEQLHHPIDQALAIVKASAKQKAARQFTDFVLSPAGRALLEKYGYAQPRNSFH